MTEDKASNFIPISRKIFQNDLWLEERQFSRFEAWLDLLQLVSYENKSKTLWINGVAIEYGRGEYPCSIRFLQERWGWGSTTKVTHYIAYLKSKTMIRQQIRQGINVITICNYDTYNPQKINDNTAKNQKVRHGKDNTNKERNKEDISSTIINVGLPTSTPTSGTSSEEIKVPVGVASKSITERAQLFVDRFNKIRAEKIGAPSKYQATKPVVASFGARLKDYTPAQMLSALKNVFEDKWHQENNYQHVTPEYILRPVKMEKYVNVVAAEKTTVKKMIY